MAHRVIETRSIRAAARDLQRAPASVATALRRLEAAISVPLVEKAGAGLVLTLEAQRLAPDIARAAAIVAAMFPQGGNAPLETLWRLASVARLGSVRRAAQALRLGQPQLTRQISGLEAALGTQLLTRSSSGSTTTAAGEALVAQIGELSAVWARLSHAAGDRFRKSVSTMRLGSVIPLGHESELARMLADLTARWRLSHPHQPLFVSSTTAEDLLAGLRSGRFDAAVLDVETVPPELESRLIYRSRLALVGAAPALAASRDLPALLTGMPVAVPSLRSGLRQAVTRVIEETLSAEEQRRLTLIEIDSIPVIVNLVLHHGYLSVLPEASVGNVRSDLGRLPLGEDHALTLRLVWPRAASGRDIGAALFEAMSRAAPSQA